MAGDDLTVRASVKDEMSRPLGQIRGELGRVSREADATGRSAIAAGSKLERLSGGVVGLTNKIGRGLLTALKGGVIGLAGLGVGIGGLAVKLIGLASEAGETQSKFDTVFKGIEADVGGYLKGLSDKFGIYSKDLQDAASNFGVFGQAAGIPQKALGAFTKDLVGAGLDLASFYNKEPGDVFQALQSGLAGETEPLRAFGIFISEAGMKAQAASMGLTGTLTEQQKVLVRQGFIMASFRKQAAFGDLARTSTSLSNQWKGLKGRTLELGKAIGMGLTPAASWLVLTLSTKLAPVISKLAEQMPNLNAALSDGDWEGVAEVVDNLAGNTGRLIAPLNAVFDAIKGGDTSGAVRAIDNLVGAGGNLEQAFNIAKGVVHDAGVVLRDVLIPALGDAADAIPALLSPLGLIPLGLNLMAEHTGTARVAIEALVVGLFAYRAGLFAVAGAQAIWSGATAAASVVTWLYTAAVGTNNTLLYNRLGYYVLEAGALVSSAAGWVAATAATVANTVARWANQAASGVGYVLTFIAIKALEAGAWIASTAATVASTAALWLNRAASATGLAALWTFVAAKAAEAGAWIAGTAATVASTAAMWANRAAAGAAYLWSIVAAKGAEAGAWVVATASTVASTAAMWLNRAAAGAAYLWTLVAAKGAEAGAWVVSTAATVAGTAAMWLNQAAAGVGYVYALVAAKAAEAGAWVVATAATVAGTVAAGAATVGGWLATAATGAWAAATWVLNAALAILTAPITLVVLGIALLIGGLILAYQKVGWFRAGVDALWGAIQTAAGWLTTIFLKFTPLGLVISHASEIWGALKGTISTVVDVFMTVVRWVGDVIGKVDLFGPAISGAQAVWGGFRDVINSIVDAFKSIMEWGGKALDMVGNVAGKAGDIAGGVGGFLNPFGDTATSRATAAPPPAAAAQLAPGAALPGAALPAAATPQVTRPSPLAQAPRTGLPSPLAAPSPLRAAPRLGGPARRTTARGAGPLGRTLAMHAALSAGSTIRVTNALVGGGGRGRGSGDHQSGRALDLVGSGLPGYASRLRDAGGYAAFHGEGSARHLHSVYPAGDTARSMARPLAGQASAGGGGGDTIVVRQGAIVVHAQNEMDVERAISRGLAAYSRERRERV